MLIKPKKKEPIFLSNNIRVIKEGEAKKNNNFSGQEEVTTL